MWPDYIGLDPEPVRSLASKTIGWRDTIADVLSELTAAETLTGEPSGVIGRLHHLSDTGHDVGVAMHTAVHEATTFTITGTTWTPPPTDLPTGHRSWSTPFTRTRPAKALPPPVIDMDHVNRSVDQLLAQIDLLARPSLPWRQLDNTGRDAAGTGAGAVAEHEPQLIEAGLLHRRDQILRERATQERLNELQEISAELTRLHRRFASVGMDAPELTAHIRHAERRGVAPNADARLRLRALFHDEIDIPAVADAATAFALQGLDLDASFALASHEDVNAIFDHIAEDIDRGVRPGSSGLPADLYPREYRDFTQARADVHATQHQTLLEERSATFPGHSPGRTDAIEDTYARLEAHRDAVQLKGLDGDLFRVSDGDFSEFAALSAVAASYAGTSSRWLGGALTGALNGDWDNDEVVRAGELLVADDLAAATFFRQLGAQGTAELPEHLLWQSPELFDQALPIYGDALAAASHLTIGFTGRQLIDADIATTDSRYNTAPGIYPELLLLGENSNDEFLLGATVASLEQRGADYDNWSNWLSPEHPGYDPRLVATQAVLDAELGHELIRWLDDRDLLREVIEPDLGFDFHTLNPHMRPVAEHPITYLLAQAGTDQLSSTIVVDYLHDRGGYETIPVELSLYAPDRFDFRRDLDNPPVVNGLSAMLAVGATHFVAASDEIQERFFGAYHTVLQSGAGDDLAVVGNGPLLQTAVNEQLAAGITEPEFVDLSQFIARVEYTRRIVQGRDAEAVDRAQANLARNLSILSLFIGLAPGAAATAASTLISGASLVAPTSATALDLSRKQTSEVRDRSIRIEEQLVIGALLSGVVTRGRNGPSVDIEFLGSTPDGTPRYRLSDAPAGTELVDLVTASVAGQAYYETREFADLVVHTDNGPLSFEAIHDFALELDNAVDRAERDLELAAPDN